MENQKEQMENQERRFLKHFERQESLHKAQMEALLSAVDKTNTVASTSFCRALLQALCSSTRHRSFGQITGRDSVRLSALPLFPTIERLRFS